MQPIWSLTNIMTKSLNTYQIYKTNHLWRSVDFHIQDVAGSRSHIILIVKATNTSKYDNNLPMSIICLSQWDIWIWQWIEKSENQNQRLEQTSLVKPAKPHRLMGTGPGLAHQAAACRVVGYYWNRTEPFLQSETEPLGGYSDPLLPQFAKYRKSGKDFIWDLLTDWGTSTG